MFLVIRQKLNLMSKAIKDYLRECIIISQFCIFLRKKQTNKGCSVSKEGIVMTSQVIPWFKQQSCSRSVNAKRCQFLTIIMKGKLLSSFLYVQLMLMLDVLLSAILKWSIVESSKNVQSLLFITLLSLLVLFQMMVVSAVLLIVFLAQFLVIIQLKSTPLKSKVLSILLIYVNCVIATKIVKRSARIKMGLGVLITIRQIENRFLQRSIDDYLNQQYLPLNYIQKHTTDTTHQMNLAYYTIQMMD